MPRRRGGVGEFLLKVIKIKGTGQVIVTPHRHEWPESFRKEATLLKKIFGKAALNIHHIGSTAVPGLCAKPIIDILIEVKQIAKVDSFNQKMERQGYRAMGEYGISGRRFFPKEKDGFRTHHVHIFEKPEIKRHLNFRDYLIANPEEREAYGQLKERLAQKYPSDVESYQQGKNDFIKSIERKAAVWRRRGK